MRRPMSIASQKNGQISIIYKVVGDGTDIMRSWVNGDNVDLIGPLGNKWNNFLQKAPILIGGGVGIAPILNLHNHLKLKKYLNSEFLSKYWSPKRIQNYMAICIIKLELIIILREEITRKAGIT